MNILLSIIALLQLWAGFSGVWWFLNYGNPKRYWHFLGFILCMFLLVSVAFPIAFLLRL